MEAEVVASVETVAVVEGEAVEASVGAVVEGVAVEAEEVQTEQASVDSALEAEINEIAVAMGERTIAGALAGEGPYEFHLNPKIVARIDGPETGLWEKIPVNDGPAGSVSGHRLVQVTNWVAWKDEVIEPLVLDADGCAVPASDATYGVQIITGSGRVKRATGFTARDAHNVEAVTDKIDVGVMIPEEIRHKKSADNMMRTMGFEERKDSSEFTSTGILRREDGKHVYLMPAGSVSAKGLEPEYTVGAPAGSAKNALRPALAATGFDKIAEGEDLREAVRAIKAYLAITPSRKDYGYGSLGVIFAAPIPMGRKTALGVFCEPEAGKTLSAGCLQSFISGVGVDGKSMSLTFSKGTTIHGANLAAGWHSQSAIFADDFRISGDVGDSKVDAIKIAVFEAIIQACYGADGRSAGNKGGGLAATSTTTATAIITAEGQPLVGSAINSRYVGVQMKTGDFAITPRGTSPLDRFVSEYANTGLARAMYASYARWLMGQIDAAGGIQQMQALMDERKKAWESEQGGRSSEVASVLAVGWQMAIEWATEMGIEEALPTIQEVSAEILEMAVTNAASTAELAPGKALVGWLRDQVASRKAYVAGPSQGIPSLAIGYQLGWEDGQHGLQHGNSSLLIGYLSRDGRSIQVTGAAIVAAKRQLGLGKVEAKQTAGFFKDLVVPGSNLGGRASATLGITSNPRGFTFPVALFDLDEPAEDVAPVAPAARVAAKAPAPADVDNDDDF